MSKRFVAVTAERLAAHLRASGIDPEAHIGPPTRRLGNGCGDPGCCAQHPGHNEVGQPMLSVVTTASGTRLHRIAVELGLVKEGG